MNGGVTESLNSNEYGFEPEPQPCYNNCDYYGNDKRSGGQEYADLQKRMEDFFTSEFGNILLSDVHMEFTDVSSSDKTKAIYGETQSRFPVLADGTELVVRGRLDSNSMLLSSFRALTMANTKDGAKSWSASRAYFGAREFSMLPKLRSFEDYAASTLPRCRHFARRQSDGTSGCAR